MVLLLDRPFPGGLVSESTAPGGIRNADLLGVYTNDHLASATGGIELVGRMLGRWRGTPYQPRLEELRDELLEERSALRGTMEALGLPVREYKQAAVWLGEKIPAVGPGGVRVHLDRGAGQAGRVRDAAGGG
jgi:hypothetical protein